MTESSIIFKPLQEVMGTGKIYLEDHIETDINFRLQILRNGKGIGSLFFNNPDSNINEFFLTGTVCNTSDDVTVEDCRMTGFTGSEVRFSFRSMKISRRSIKSLTSRPQGKVFLEASLLNMYQTRNLTSETEIGQLSIGVYDNIDEIERIMRVYEIPLVTSFLQIDVISNDSQTLDKIMLKGETVIENFLRVTSLYQMVWQGWVTLGLYERDTGSILFFKFSSPKLKAPNSSPLGQSRYDANQFINSERIQE